MVERFVSAQAFAETYDGGWETVKQYREANRLAEERPEMARAEIARQVGRPPGAIRGWLVEDKTPAPVKALRTARDRGWIECESCSETFRALNHLVAWVFSGGGIQRERYVPIFSVDDQLALTTLDRLLTWANTTYRIRDDGANTDEHALEVIPDDAATSLGRVLHVLGAPTGVKATQDDLELPSYLDAVTDPHRRDFLRIHLLNRARGLDDGGTAGTWLYSPMSDASRRNLREMVDTVTTGSATITTQDRLWVSADAVRDLAGDTPLRSALATQAAYGSLRPPTARALASTYRRTKRPSGYRYAKLYRIMKETDHDLSHLVNQHPDLTKAMVRNWRRGHTPRVHTALREARERGWLTPPATSPRALSLTALAAWGLARGTVRSNAYHPVFRLKTPGLREHFDDLAEPLGLSYTLRHEENPRPTEIHLTEKGSLLGRVLHVLGVPRGRKKTQPCLPPGYLFHHPEHAREFVINWSHHRSHFDDTLVLTVPNALGDQFRRAYASLLTHTLSWDVEQTHHGVRVLADAGGLDRERLQPASTGE